MIRLWDWELYKEWDKQKNTYVYCRQNPLACQPQPPTLFSINQIKKRKEIGKDEGRKKESDVVVYEHR